MIKKTLLNRSRVQIPSANVVPQSPFTYQARASLTRSSLPVLPSDLLHGRRLPMPLMPTAGLSLTRKGSGLPPRLISSTTKRSHTTWPVMDTGTD